MEHRRVIKISFTLVISICMLLISSFSPSSAQEFDSPKPIIKDSKIYPGAQYTSTAIPGTLKLAFGEGIYWYGIRAVLLEAANKNSSCVFGTNNGTEIAQVIKEVGSLNTFPIQSISWTNPADSAGKQICIHVQWRSKATGVGGGYQNTYLATTFKDISVIASASPSPSPSPTSTIATEFVEPSGSKPSISGTPVEGSKFKVSIKAWNMNGNDFEGRAVYLFLCRDSNCNNVVKAYPVAEPANFDDAKTITMPTVLGKAGQFVKIVDRVTYPALGSGELNEDLMVELSSSTKKIVNAQSSSPSATPTNGQSIDETNTDETQDLNSLENDAEVMPGPDVQENSNLLSGYSFGIILGVMSLTLIFLLLILIYVIKKKK